MKEKTEKRFIVKEEQSDFFTTYSIIVDTITGVNYIVLKTTTSHSITPLLNHKGEVVIDRIYG